MMTHFLALEGVPPDRLAGKLRDLAFEMHNDAYHPVRWALGALYTTANDGPMANPAPGWPPATCTLADIKEARDTFDRALAAYEVARGPIDALLERAAELDPPKQPDE